MMVNSLEKIRNKNENKDEDEFMWEREQVEGGSRRQIHSDCSINEIVLKIYFTLEQNVKKGRKGPWFGPTLLNRKKV